MHLIAVFFQVVLDAALEEVQLGFQLLREAKHAVLTPSQVGVVAQEAQPGGGRRRHLRVRRLWKEEKLRVYQTHGSLHHPQQRQRETPV